MSYIDSDGVEWIEVEDGMGRSEFWPVCKICGHAHGFPKEPGECGYEPPAKRIEQAVRSAE